jgi:hypothetical protein
MSELDNSFELYFKNNDIIKNDEPSNTVKLHTDERLRSEGNAHNITMVGELISHLLSAAWGNEWGSFIPAYSYTKATLPTITYRIISRENSKKTPIKYKKLGIIDEIVDEKPTGDVFEEYIKVQDCLLEIDIYTQNNSSSEELAEKFEDIIDMYIGQLKKLGVSEMYFVKEIPSEDSYEERNEPHKTLIYFLELQKLNLVRQSTIKNIKIQLVETLKENDYDIETETDSFIYSTQNRLE